MNIDINVNYPKPVEIYDKRRDDLTPKFFFDDEGIYLGNGCYRQMVVSREVLTAALKQWNNDNASF